jgi:hypothetical protein
VRFGSATGQAMRVNLFVIGTMKGGTHAAHALLGGHPAISMSRFKEPSHFVDAATLARVWREPLTYQDPAAYQALFPSTPQTRYRGEASTLYTCRPTAEGVAERIWRYNPEARLIYLVRDPLRRIVSHYFQERRLDKRPGTFAETVRGNPHFAAYSDYAYQLAPYVERFPRDSLRIVVSERLKRDPQGEMGRLFAWLGLEPAAVTIDETKHHVTPDAVGLPRPLLMRTRLYNSRLWRLARRHAPTPVARLARRLLFTDRIRQADVSAADIDEATQARVAAAARAFYDLIGGPVAEWRDTNAAMARYADDRSAVVG